MLRLQNITISKALITWHHNLRGMGTMSAALHKFIVYAPDKQDEDTFQKRLSVRATHFEVANTRIANGIISEEDNISSSRKFSELIISHRFRSSRSDVNA